MPSYSGAQVYTTFNGGATRTELADNFKDALVACGWTVASGSSGDWKLDSGITDNGLQLRVRVYDPGSGTSAILYLSLVDDSLPLDTIYMPIIFNPAETWEMYANPFFCFAHVLPWPGTSDKQVAFGTGWTPDFFHDGSPNECVAVGIQQRNRAGLNSFGTALIAADFAAIWNASRTQQAPGGGGDIGSLSIDFPQSARLDQAIAVRWAVDDSYLISDPLVVFSMISHSDTTDRRVRMVLYDAIVVAGQYEAGDEITWDGYIWRAITHNNAVATLFALKEPV